MEINIKEFYNDRILEVLSVNENLINDKEIIEILDRGFIYPEKISKDKILFLGINPSFINRNDSDKKMADPNKKLEGDEYLGFNKIRYEKEITEIPKEERYQNYFKVFDKISKDEDGWSHYDLLPFRERNQNLITKYFTSKEITIQNILKDFISISREIIENSDPKIIIVANAFLRNLTNMSDDKHFNLFETEFNNSIGTHVIKNGPLESKPVFFTSMLSGQRALDVGSRERLEWHINKIIN